MDKKVIGIIILLIFVLTSLIIFIIISQKTGLSPNTSNVQTNLEECNSLIYNRENAFNLLFFSDKQGAQNYSDFFFQTPPFSENKNSFNIYYIDNFTPKCELYKGIAILCYSRELIKKAASCPNDYIIVLKNEKPEIRSSSYMNVLSINTNHQLSVLSHEFGHAFGNFAEEYVPASIPKGSKNCLFSCEEFGDTKNGCYEGCSKNNAFRSIESGVMRTLSTNNFGKYNEILLLNEINEINQQTITGNVVNNIVDCSKENYYLIEAIYKDNKIELITKTLENGCFGENGAGPFSYKIIKTDNSEIRGNEFNPELIFTDAPKNGEINGETYIQEGTFLLKIPEITNSKSLEISLDGNRIIEINLKDVGARPCLS